MPLFGVTYDPNSKTNGLVHKFVNHMDIRDLHDDEISLSKISKYVYQILKVQRLKLLGFENRP